MNIKIFADGSDIKEIFDLYENNKLVKGFTTNPSLMKKAGVTNYEAFIKEVTSKIKDLSISFEVFADDHDGMLYQAEKIASFGENVYVKIPITNTKGEYTTPVIQQLIDKKIKVNVTAVFTNNQINKLNFLPLDITGNVIISIFSGRIADTGRNPMDTINYAVYQYRAKADILWASTREIYNIYQAEEAGCDIITASTDQIKKFSILQNKNLTEYSLETVKMFYDDAKSSGLSL